MPKEVERAELLKMASDIVAAYVGNHDVARKEMSGLINQTFATLEEIALGAELGPMSGAEPPVPIEESVTDDYIVCLEDGKQFKSLKRHLRTQYDLTPEDYRAKWGLPADYPMVAPNYARTRSRLAKDMQLGRSKPE